MAAGRQTGVTNRQKIDLRSSSRRLLGSLPWRRCRCFRELASESESVLGWDRLQTPRCRVIDILLVGFNEAAAAVNGCRKRNYSWHPKPRDMGRSRNCRTLVMCRLLARNCPTLSLSYGHFEVSLQRCTSVVASMALDCIGTGCAVVGEIRV